MASYPTEEYTYPDSEWAKLSPEDKEVMREIKRVFGNVTYSGSGESVGGVVVLPKSEWTHEQSR